MHIYIPISVAFIQCYYVDWKGICKSCAVILFRVLENIILVLSRRNDHTAMILFFRLVQYLHPLF